jgi:hypothetical protein
MESRLDDQASAASGLTSAKSVSGPALHLEKSGWKASDSGDVNTNRGMARRSRGTRNYIDAKPE